MRQEIASLIDGVQKQERRNRISAVAIVAASLVASGALFLVALQFYPKWVAMVIVLLAFPLLLWAQRPGIKSLRFSRQDAASAIDAALNAKARTVSLLSLEQTNPDGTQVARELMELQLGALVTDETDARSIAPYSLSLAEKRSLQVLGLCIVAMLSLLFFRPLSPLEELAQVIEQIQAESPELPPEVLQATNSLLEQLQDPDAEPRDISSAISSTQEIIASAQGQGLHLDQDRCVSQRSLRGDSSSKPQNPGVPTKTASQDTQPPPSNRDTASTQNSQRDGSENNERRDKQNSTKDSALDAQPNSPKQQQERKQQEKKQQDKKQEGGADSKQQQANDPSNSPQEAQQNQEQSKQQGDSQGQDSQQQQQQQPNEGSKPQQGSQETQQSQQDQQQGSQGGEQQQQQQNSAQKQGGEQNQEDQANPQGGGSSGAGGSGQGSSGEGQQDSQEQSDPGSGQSQGAQGSAQEGKEGQGKERQGKDGQSPQGSQSDDSDAAQAGQDSQKSGMQKLEQALKKAEDALKNAEQKEQGGSQGEGDASKNKEGGKDSSSQGKSKQDSGKQDSSKQGESKGQEGNKQGNKQDKAQDSKGDSPESSTKDSKADQSGQKPAGSNEKISTKQGEPSGAKPGEKGSQESKKQNERNENKPGSQDSTGANSPDIDRNAKARPGSAEDEGPPGPGLGGKEEFKEVAIDTDNEKLDERYTGDESSLEQSDAPAQPKTSIEDVTLAKPKPSSQKLEQPIPLEYRDVLK